MGLKIRKVQFLNDSQLGNLELDFINSQTGLPYSNIIGLPNGSRVKIGDHLIDMKNNHEIGEVIELTPESILIKRKDNSNEIISLDSPMINDLLVMPF